MTATLPIDALLPKILETIQAQQNLVVTASPGSGKTTRIPPALLHSNVLPNNKKILVLVPRRVAAKYAALRVASELHEECGQSVGYQFRFEKKMGLNTRILFVTEGLFMRFVVHDPSLQDVGCVILDEFHERHLHTDLAFAVLKNLQNTTRSDLKILVMSATIDADNIAKALNNCAVVTQNVKPHPLAIHYQSLNNQETLENGVSRVVQNVLRLGFDKHGHILVFLPGMAQIRKCEDLLLQMGLKNSMILPLHGDLSRDEQDLIFQETSQTKIILATNIAESSVTIPGVRTVVDSGLHRQAGYSAWSGLPSLVTTPISQASAMQRAGRAARTDSGQCIRMYSEHEYNCRPAFDVPEIRRSELAQALLELKVCGFKNLADIPWYEAPPLASVQTAQTLLRYLGALDADELTQIGRRMAELPMHPRLSRLLIEASQTAYLDEALNLAARLSEGASECANLLDDLKSKYFSDTLKRAITQWQNILQRDSLPQQKNRIQGERAEVLQKCFFVAFPDRVAKIRTRHVKRAEKLLDEWVLALGGELLIESGLVAQNQDHIVVLDARSSASQKSAKAVPWIKSFVNLQEEQLLEGPKDLLKDVSETTWDEGREAVLQIEELKYGNLILSSSKSKPNDAEKVLMLLLRRVFKWDLNQLKNLSNSDLEHAIQHVQDPQLFLSSWARLEFWQKFNPDCVSVKIASSPGEAFQLALTGIDQLKELKDCDLGLRLFAALPSEVASQIQNQLPDRLKLPKGRPAKIHYAAGQKPWIESRLQDFFGMKKNPTVMNGKIPLTVHLLAPNGRAVQVTSDLAGFWVNTYPSVRLQLMRRYPKHQWPETV